MATSLFRVPPGALPVVVKGAPHGPDDPPFAADPDVVGPLVRAGWVIPEPTPLPATKPDSPKAAKARQEAEA